MVAWSTVTMPVCCQPGGNFSSCPQDSWYAVVFRDSRTSCAKAASKAILRMYTQPLARRSAARIVWAGGPQPEGRHGCRTKAKRLQTTLMRKRGRARIDVRGSTLHCINQIQIYEIHSPGRQKHHCGFNSHRRLQGCRATETTDQEAFYGTKRG